MGFRFNRTFTPNVPEMLLPSGPLDFLISGVPGQSDDPGAIDIQIREHNKLMYYHGTTRLLVVQVRDEHGKIKAAVHADKKGYAESPACQNQYTALKTAALTDDIGEFREAFQQYLLTAVNSARPRYYRGTGNGDTEGYWQNQLCVRYGRNWIPGDEWLVIDRECVIGFDSEPEKQAFYSGACTEYQSVRNVLQSQDQRTWGRQSRKPLGDELDMIAINGAGQLCVIELKHGRNSSGIYWGPLQVGLYHRAFTAVIAATVGKIQELARQKIELGLIPPTARGLVDNVNPTQIESVLAVAEPNDRSRCWDKMRTVVGAMDRAGVSRTPIRVATILPGTPDFTLQLRETL